MLTPYNNIIPQRRYSLVFLWLLLAVSGMVMIEPAPFDLLGISLAVIFFASGMKVPRDLAIPILLWSIYIVFSILACFFTQDPALSIKPLSIRIFLIVIWLFLTCLIYEDPRRNLQIALQGYAIAVVITSIIAVLAYYRVLPNSDLFLEYGRAKGTFKDPNVFAPFIVPMFVLYFSRLESNEGHKILIPVIILGIISIALLLGFSRGSWLNLGMALVFYLAIRLFTMRDTRELSRLAVIGFLAFLAAAFLIGWLISTDAISDLFETRAKLVQSYDTHGRFEAQKLMLSVILENPLGVGPGNIGFISELLPHNVYIYIFSEAGWVAGMAYVTFVVLTLMKGFKYCLIRSDLQLTALVIFSCLLSTQLQSFLIDSTHWRHLYVLYAFMWGVMLYNPAVVENYDTACYPLEEAE